MDDEQDAGSGSRWEPESGRPADETSELGTPEPARPGAETPAGRRDWMRSRAALTGAGVGLAAVIGLGGFAIGHATADGDGGHRKGPGFHHLDGGRDGNGRGHRPRMGPHDRPEAPPQGPNVAPAPTPSAGGSSSSDNSSS